MQYVIFKHCVRSVKFSVSLQVLSAVRKIQDVRLSAQLAEITGLSGMICGLGDPTVGSRSRWDTGGNPVDYACMASLLYDRVKSSPLWQSLYSLSSNAFGRKIFCLLFLIIRAFHVFTALTLSNNFVSTVIKYCLCENMIVLMRNS